MISPALLRRGFSLGLVALFVSALHAEVRCAKLFTDHMVLQRERPVPIWGTAAPGERVTVAFAEQTKTIAARPDGTWRVTLDPLATSAAPRELTVRGTNTLTFSDVLVGEVWFASGQSNMEKPLGERKGQKPTLGYDLEIAAANYPLLRLFQVPRTDLKQDGPGVLRWLPCSPEALRESNFSAAAYFFGRNVQQTLGVPVGIIHASFGGTRIEAWLPAEAFADPQLAGLEKERYPAWVPGVQPTELFQSMVRPYAPFAIRGFLWYQGETNCTVPDSDRYAHKLTTLIAHWRRAWENADAPFYGVLLAPFDYSKWEKFGTTDQALPRFWQAQIEALSAPHTGYAVISDGVDDLHDIHPVNKRVVGDRLARLALHETFGRTAVAARGPTLASWKVDGATIVLTYAHAEGLHTRDRLPPTDFVVAGADRVFHPATAVIKENTITLTCPDVPAPVAARFAWHEIATPNLLNRVGLPAVPFRTDEWPVKINRPATKSLELRP
ncbi:MAG: sialate O-acetylesterase [Opitutae bacterium]|nr:sialate O-acetylesterase [Opitutae bacterium]